MYRNEYERWLAADLEDADLKPELTKIKDNENEIKERFAVALKFGRNEPNEYLCSTSGHTGAG